MQAPYNTATGLMNTDLLAADTVPSAHPYNTTPWNYPGTEHLGGTNANLVDWVLVEMRDTNRTTVLDRRAGLLLKTGEIVDTNFTSGLKFYNIQNGKSYYVVILHRNHLSVMTGNPVLCRMLSLMILQIHYLTVPMVVVIKPWLSLPVWALASLQ